MCISQSGRGRVIAADVEQDLENGGEAAARPALRRTVLTDEQRDEIREAFDLYVPRSCFFASLPRRQLFLWQLAPRLLVWSGGFCGWLDRLALVFVLRGLYQRCFLYCARRALTDVMVW